ncbi:MAG: cation:proton antiporter [Moraxellaceae bacterium]|nr:cation:proton antiporter [Moraxellaceae bacterium]
MNHHALELLLLLLAVAVAVVALFRSLNLPTVLAYLAVGAVLGPHAAGVVPDNDSARYLAEFGVVFLMFSIGLEFSLPRLFAMKRTVLGLGGLQVTVTLAVGTLLLWLAGVTPTGAFAVAGAIVMSSTALLSKLLTDRLELDAPHGRAVIGVLLFQDLAVVPLLILIPALSRPAEMLAMTLGIAALKAAVVLFIMLYLGQRLMRPWFTVVARRKSSELFMLNVLLVTLGLSWVTEKAGLSMALGAFLAGMLISETEYRYQVEEDIKPFRDVLVGFFLVTVGMLLDFDVLAEHAWLVLAALSGLLIIKFAVIFGVARAMGDSTSTAVRSGLWLCAGGEFGFVLLGQTGGLLSASAFQIFVAALVLSLLIAPLLVQVSDKVVMRFVASEWLMRSMELTRVAAQSMRSERHVILCGFGRSGQYMARFLEQEGIGYIALDIDPDLVREAAAAGSTVVFGDSARRENLVAAGIMRASVVVVSFNDLHSTLRVMHHVQAIRPEVPIVARAAGESEMEQLLDSGATEVVPEMLEASIMLASHTLALSGVPLSRVIRRMRDIRAQRYGLMRGFFHGTSESADRPEAQQERLQSISLTPGAWAIGLTLGDLNLEGLGVKVSALRRRGIRATEPGPETRLAAGDVLVLLGGPADLALAELRVLKGG